MCIGLENRLKNNDMVSCFNVLNPTELSSRHNGMRSWGISKLERLCNPFGKDRKIDEKKTLCFDKY